ncbi:MAG: cache domain-containing protein, partial [Spirochaetales bacterium]|nr:cache domain-containing protein [Spirochaetales bacterium]
MKRKFRPAIHLLLPLMLLFFPLGLFFIVRLDVKSVDYTLQDRSEYLKSVLTSIDYSFSSYEQLISTTVTIVETLPSDRKIHEDSLRSIFSSSQSALVYGIGIWYEPFAFNDETERFGPYIRQTKPLEKESEITYFWNTPDYNYHGREWYKTSLAAEGDRPSVTPPFFDHDYTYITFGKP